ncbi:ion transporter [Pyruvatibacter sp.]|nr:ion transporter [Alphaproteobacteria bacterium]
MTAPKDEIDPHYEQGAAEARSWFDRQLLLDSWDGRGLSPLNWVILVLIILSVVLFTVETMEGLSPNTAFLLDLVNDAILLIFAIEFCLRLWCAGQTRGVTGLRNRAHYAGRFWLSVDFLAFGPELIVLVATGFMGADLAWLRAFRLARLFKLAKYFEPARVVIRVLRSTWRQLMVAAVIASLVIYSAAVIMYLFERDTMPEAFGSIPKAMWWSVVTLSTVGYGDVVPATLGGRLAAGLLILGAIGLVSLPSGIIAGAFQDELRQQRERERLEEEEEAGPKPGM